MRNCSKKGPKKVGQQERSFLTSRTFSSISTVRGKSSLMATVALKALDDSLHLGVRPRTGCWPGGLWMYSDHVTFLFGGGCKVSFLLAWKKKSKLLLMYGDLTKIRSYNSVSLILFLRAGSWIKRFFLVKSLKYEFCNKSFRKDEPLTSWTLF